VSAPLAWDLLQPPARPHLRQDHAIAGWDRNTAQVSSILALQRSAGNQAVTELLTRRVRRNPFFNSLDAAMVVQRCGPAACDCAATDDRDGGFTTVQRDAQKAKQPAPKDVVVILSPPNEKADAATNAAVMAPGAQLIYATSPNEMVTKLKALKQPVKTLFFLGHSNADGDIVFESPGKQDVVPAAKIAEAVKGVITAEAIDFQGCAVAVSPEEMDKVRTAVKATKARGSTCELVRQVAGPIVAPGKKAITDPKSFDLSKPENRKLFDAGMKKLHEAFGDDRKKCIVNDSEGGYFQAGGRLVAIWANPESIAGNEAFDKGKSVCYSALKVEKVDPKKHPVIDENQCKLVEVEK
jgi:hypothetical protein